MKYLLIATILLFSFCSFGQVPDSTWKVDTVQRVWRHAISRETIPYDKLSPALRRFIDTLICKHVYVAVEQPRVERNCHITEHPMLRDLILNRDWREPKIGSHQSDHDEKDMAEGIAIVCIKCHHETKQKIHYSHK